MPEALPDEKESEISIPCTDCKTMEVTVFTDRAQVTRQVKLSGLEPGQHTVVVKGLSQLIDTNSVTAKGLGDMTLRSVSCEMNYPTAEPPNPDAAKTLVDKIRLKREEIQGHERAQARLTSEFELAKQFCDGVVKKGGKGEEKSGWAALDASAINNVTKLMEFYREQSVKKDERETEIKEKLRVARNELNQLEAEKRTRAYPSSSQTPSNDVKVVIQTETRLEKAEIILTYMCSGASWTPSYDLRARSTSTEVQLTYYGTVRQSTGEAWKGVNLFLSTAKPQVGGTPPELPTKNVEFFAPRQIISASSKGFKRRTRKGRAASAGRHVQSKMLECSNIRRQSLDFGVEEDAGGFLREAAVAVADVESSGGAATFAIAAISDVLSDNKPQKVTICILNMKTLMSHFCVPTESAYAYLQCKTTNESKFELLASSEVNVFFDGSFVSTSKMPSVSPGESFQSFLGADNSVKITANPPFKQHAQGGYFSKTRSSTHTLITKIKNTKADTDVFVICSKQLPRSNDSSIKVTPVIPSPQQLEGGAQMEKQYAEDKTGKLKPPMNYVKIHETKNNVVWKRIVKAQQETTFKLQYIVEWPKHREVRYR